MKIDLHVHTLPHSKCSNVEAREMISEARAIGLDGFCLTEHQALPDLEEIKKLGLDNGVRIFQGNEITTAQGDVLVFGFYEDIQGIITAKKLQKKVKAAGGFSIAAHPFRGFKVFSLGDGAIELGLDQACKKKIFQHVDAVEIRNGRVTDKENKMAEDAAKKLGLPATAGSDVHSPGDLGKWVTVFEQDIQNETQLTKALCSGHFTTASLHKK